jgi:pilus assembly protein CpaB
LKNKVLLFIAIGLGLISALLTYNYLSGIEAKQHVEMVDVVVANTKISANTEIRASMLAWKKIPKESLHPDAVQQLQDLQGRITAADIVAGEQVLWSRLLPKGAVPGLAYNIPKDKRAVTVAVNEVIGVAGFIKPGDRVDVLATFANEPPITTTVLQNVMVLAISQDMTSDIEPAAVISTSVTFALSPNQAEQLVLAESLGAIRLSLRPPEAVGIASKQGTSAYDLQPLAYSAHGTELESRREVSSKTQSEAVSAVKPQKSQQSTGDISSGKTSNDIKIEIFRGTEREVILVDK